MAENEQKQGEELPKIVEEKCRRRLKAQKEGEHPIFFGLGMFGVVGWTIAIPTVAGVFIGRWLDAGKGEGSTISWTLTFMFAGLIFGAFGAWRWMNKEGRKDENG